MGQGTSCATTATSTGSSNLGTPGTTKACVAASSITDFAQNAGGLCTGSGGMGYSNYYYKFCTDASNSCVAFNFSTGSGGFMAALYTTGCALVSGSAVCNDGGGSGTFSTAGNDPGVNLTAASSCYVLRIQIPDAEASLFSFCYYKQDPPQDECSTAIGIDGTAQATDNYCATEAATDPAPAQICAGSLENTVWYQFTAANPCGSPCDVVITTSNILCSGGAAGFQIGYFTGTCGSLSNLGCTSGTGGTVNATISNATPGASYYVALDGDAGANCSFNISATNTIPLPVELLYFRGYADNDRDAQLQWATASETRASRYEVMRSRDGINYDLVGSVSAKNSIMGGEYILNDPRKLEAGITYYKLIQFDTDGNYEEFNQIAIGARASIEDLLLVPNPVNDIGTIFFNARKSGQIGLVITDMLGRIVADKTIDIVKGGNSVPLEVVGYDNGLYFVRIITDDEISSIKFTKQN